MTTLDPNEVPINRLFSLRLEQIGKLSDLKERTGKDMSELVREAINNLFDKYEQAQIKAAGE